MAVTDQHVTDDFALYLGDCLEVLPTIPTGSVHASIYSPPFFSQGGTQGLYVYSSSDRDFSNSRDYAEFQEHYTFLLQELTRVTMPGRLSCVHCMDLPLSNTGRGDALHDFPGDLIRLHEAHGWRFVGRHFIWKEPLTVRNRTMTKALAHKTIVEDATKRGVAGADQLVLFRAPGENPVPVAHPHGLTRYAGEREVPSELLGYRGWTGNQIENRYSHWIWRQYASSFWDDVRLDHVLPYKPARDEEDERHVHPLQLDVIERAVVLATNPGETVLTPFMGVGSEVYGAVRNGRRAVGVELKPSYYRQALKNVEAALLDAVEGDHQPDLFRSAAVVAPTFAAGTTSEAAPDAP
jgi:hypothetical protein